MFSGLGFALLNPPLVRASSVRNDLTSASSWGESVLCSGLVCKYGVVKRLERHQSLGRYSYFEQFDFDAVGFRHLSGELVVFIAACAAAAAADLIGGAKLMLGNIQILFGACEVMGLLN